MNCVVLIIFFKGIKKRLKYVIILTVIFLGVGILGVFFLICLCFFVNLILYSC